MRNCWKVDWERANDWTVKRIKIIFKVRRGRKKNEKMVRLQKGSFSICYPFFLCLEGSGLEVHTGSI